MFLKNKQAIIVIFTAVFLFSSAKASLAQTDDKFALTITPPLIKINMGPGERWASSIRVVNNNPTATSIYADKIDFKSGEDGGVIFISKGGGEEEKTTFLLSQWLTVPTGPIALAPFETKEIPVSIDVPDNAEAGGHYASVLIGTKPNDTSKPEGSGIKVSSMLASLIMLNVKGEIMEEGSIREFTAGEGVYTSPDIGFNLRFENTGNVHLQPQGEIAIYNMFGKEKGRVAINQNSQFGNVLPKSIRKWDFSWQAEKGFLASGRYRADLVLGFGDQAKQNVSQSVYFWIIDVKMTAIIVGSILALVLLVFLLIRSYVRNAVKAVAGSAIQSPAGSTTPAPARTAPATMNIRKIRPAGREKVINLKK